MWFWLKQKHIDMGERLSDSRCPIARCLNEAGFLDTRVDCEEIDLYGDGNWFPLPEELKSFIRNFDRFESPQTYTTPEPFSFELEVE